MNATTSAIVTRRCKQGRRRTGVNMRSARSTERLSRIRNGFVQERAGGGAAASISPDAFVKGA